MTVAGHGSLCTSVSPLVQGTFFSSLALTVVWLQRALVPGKVKGDLGEAQAGPSLFFWELKGALAG